MSRKETEREAETRKGRKEKELVQRSKKERSRCKYKTDMRKMSNPGPKHRVGPTSKMEDRVRWAERQKCDPNGWAHFKWENGATRALAYAPWAHAREPWARRVPRPLETTGPRRHHLYTYG